MAAQAAVRQVVEQSAKKVAHKAKHVATAGPRADAPAFVAREIGVGILLGLLGGAVWKMYHVNYRKRCSDFYDALEKGEITTVIMK